MSEVPLDCSPTVESTWGEAAEVDDHHLLQGSDLGWSHAPRTRVPTAAPPLKLQGYLDHMKQRPSRTPQ